MYQLACNYYNYYAHIKVNKNKKVLLGWKN